MPKNELDDLHKRLGVLVAELNTKVETLQTNAANAEAALQKVLSGWQGLLSSVQDKIEEDSNPAAELKELANGFAAVKVIGLVDMHAHVIEPSKEGLTPAANAAKPENSLVETKAELTTDPPATSGNAVEALPSNVIAAPGPVAEPKTDDSTGG